MNPVHALPSCFFNICFNIILPYHAFRFFPHYPSISCFQVFPTRPLYAFIFSPYVLNAPPIFNLKLKGPKLRDLRLLTVSRRNIYSHWHTEYCQYRNESSENFLNLKFHHIEMLCHVIYTSLKITVF
jgi:hypothetical protein